MTSSNRDEVSIRIRLSPDLLQRIDRAAGERGRQRFIRDAILSKLDEDFPPIVNRLVDEVDELRTRVEYLEEQQSTSVYRDQLNSIADETICRDELDRKILTHFVQYEGATTPELAQELLGSESKRRTILDRIHRLNEAAKKETGSQVLEYEKGLRSGKQGAWWLINKSKIVQ
ncbi:MAG: hypothetical protein ACQET3_07810 [Promethearchaeati archaeon]